MVMNDSNTSENDGSEQMLHEKFCQALNRKLLLEEAGKQKNPLDKGSFENELSDDDLNDLTGDLDDDNLDDDDDLDDDDLDDDYLNENELKSNLKDELNKTKHLI